MKWVLILAVMLIAITSARADVTDENFLDHLITEKTRAEALVVRLNSEFAPTRQEYTIGRQKYTMAQQAFNNYINAMLSNYRIGRKVDLKESAQLAASRAKDLDDYVSNLPAKGFTTVVVAVGVLIEIGDKLYNYIKKNVQAEQKRVRDERSRIADAIARQTIWDDWDKIKS
jgi:hypothetical protein